MSDPSEGYEPVDSETCSAAPGAVTHQGAVVQQGGGEVAAEAEGQDVALPGAEGHLALWKRQIEGRWWVLTPPGLDSSRFQSDPKVVPSCDPYRSTRPHRDREL